MKAFDRKHGAITHISKFEMLLVAVLVPKDINLLSVFGGSSVGSVNMATPSNDKVVSVYCRLMSDLTSIRDSVSLLAFVRIREEVGLESRNTYRSWKISCLNVERKQVREISSREFRSRP